MIKRPEIFSEPQRWSALGEFRGVWRDFAAVTESDLTTSEGANSLTNLFGHYAARLKEQSQRADRPEIAALYLLSMVCNPDVFPSGNKIDDYEMIISQPAKESAHPLYELALETQRLAPGAAYLRGIDQLPNQSRLADLGISAAVLEWHLDKGSSPFDAVAKVPLLLYGNNDASLSFIGQIIEAVRQVETPIKMVIEHAPSLYARKRDLEVLTGECAPLWWPLAYPGGRLENPVVGALHEQPRWGAEETQFRSITLSTDVVAKTWLGMEHGKLIRSNLYPIPEIWEAWSFHNALYAIGRISTSHMLYYATRLSLDILAREGISFAPNHEATLAVHVPLQLLAAHAQTVIKGIKDNIAFRYNAQERADREERESEAGSWDFWG